MADTADAAFLVGLGDVGRNANANGDARTGRGGPGQRPGLLQGPRLLQGQRRLQEQCLLQRRHLLRQRRADL
ncbi:hypothetical protein MXD59_16055 [Frankia sp. Ag45/Mut15]|uniref:Uncharacterized protein n=1 Tax=Frankia umida TaxID=573489 RepID=A0ABT0K0N3_9ACTN|nr:hypothetical protein [Frankia umida]MCK9877270.1 hypothetical protein [Frankia umida]